MYEEVLDTQGRFRVKLVADEYAEEPYDDGQSPLLRINAPRWSDDVSVEHIMATGRPLDDDDSIEEAVRRWGSPSSDNWRLFEKYLRAYHGMKEIETWYAGGYWYVTYQSQDMSEGEDTAGLISSSDELGDLTQFVLTLNPSRIVIENPESGQEHHTAEFTSPVVLGEVVTGVTRGPWRGRAKRSVRSYETPFSGVYEGVRLSEWTGLPVHSFGKGTIGTTPQKGFAIPVSHFREKE